MLDKLLASQNEISGRPCDLSRESHIPKSTVRHSSDDIISADGRRQRRRVGDEHYSFQQPCTSSTSAPGSAVPLKDSIRMFTSQESHLTDVARSPSADSITSISEDEEFLGAVGQLSLNEDEQVRYHGKASGLHLLGNKERIDRRNEGGIWLVFFLPRVHIVYWIYFCFRRFPKARVWPPLPSGSVTWSEDEFASYLPSTEIQEHLLNLYFTYVHPLFPIIHKKAFFESYKAGYASFFPCWSWH